jgi:arylsulfatase A-like enzyme
MKQMILEMDTGVDQVRNKIIELGLADNTLIMFFSDNGDASQTATGSPNLRGRKGSVYEGGHRVPAIAWWPGKIEPNQQTDELAITLDIMPTILSIAGIDPPEDRHLDGLDLSPILIAQKPFARDLGNSSLYTLMPTRALTRTKFSSFIAWIAISGKRKTSLPKTVNSCPK